jgi:hypothetical protein
MSSDERDVSGQSESSKTVNKWRMTRRNFAAATGILAAGLVSQAGQAMAMARPPRRGGGGGGGGTNCFLAGTRIQTSIGEVPVDQLKAGDLVVTQSGATKPILQVLVMPVADGTGAELPIADLPVKIERGALAPELPRRDLFLSQSHMLLIDGTLIPAGYLVNGNTITVVEAAKVEKLAFYHIDLGEHDVVVAEGAPCESFIEHYGKTCAPVIRYGGLRSKVASRLRSAVSPFVDIRNRADVVRDRLEDRAELMRAA